MFPAVWGSLLALALLMAFNPVRLALTLLVISRPRPVHNLLTYGAGCLVGCIPAVVVPLTLLHVTPMFRSFADDLAPSPTVRYIRLGMGVLALSIAALLTVRSLTRRRQPTHLPKHAADNTSTLVLESNTPTAISWLFDRTQDAATEGGSAIRRLLRRMRNAWESGSLWVAFVIGMAFGGVEPDAGLFLLAIIVASGAAVGTQIAAAIVFVIGVLMVVEVTLLSYLVRPVKTKAIVQLLHDWALAHRRKILVAMCTVAGVSLVASAMGGI